MHLDCTSRTSLLLAVSLALGLLSSGVVRAGEQETKTRAKLLFDEGMRAIEHRDRATGCAKLRESLALFAVPNTLFNVADCDEFDRNFALAYEHWERGLALVSTKDPRARVAQKRINTLEARIARLSIVVPPSLGSITILLDGNEIAAEAFKEARVVNSGKHAILTRVRGHDDSRQEVDLAPRDRTEVVLRAGPLANTEDGLDKPKSTTLRTVSIIAFSFGAAGAIAAGVTGGLLLSRDKQIATHCDGFACDQMGVDLARGQRPLLVGNSVAWGVGAAGLGAGTMFFLLHKRTKNQNSATLLPLVTKNFLGLGVMERF
jgi:hypothetical protein